MEGDIRTMSFPIFYKSDFRSRFAVIDKFFRLYLKDSESNIFFLNHSPCEHLIKQIKCSFPLSKVVFVIHDFGWTSPLLGNSIKLKEVIDGKALPQIKETYKGVIDYFEEEQRMYASVDKVVCLSQDSYHLLINDYCVEEKKVALIPNGLQDRRRLLSKREKNDIRKRLYLHRNEKIILFVGRPCIAKGLYPILECFDEIVKKEPCTRLILIGGGVESDILLSKSAAYSCISFTGQISSAELDDWYKIADIGVVASYTEQCSFTGIEMMMYGLPIVASDGFGVRNMFQDEVNAKVALIENANGESKYADNISRAIMSLLYSNEASLELRKKARLVYEDRYVIERMKDAYCRLIDEL